VAAVAAVALLLAGCAEVDTSGDGPSFGGGSLDGADLRTADVRDAARAAGFRPCADLPLADAAASGASSSDGPSLPDVTLACLGEDGDVDLGRLRGPAVVNLWASNCKPCREELPLFARLDEQAGDRLTVVGLDVRDADPVAAVELARRSGVTYPQLADPGFAVRTPLRVVGLPQTVFVDAQGRMVATERVPYTDYDDLTDAVRRHLEVQP
jgi:thiol-disulfide isomerase/thioredoxin